MIPSYTPSEATMREYLEAVRIALLARWNAHKPVHQIKR
jgi:hypothetical protein